MGGAFGSVPPGADLSSHARMLRRVHEALLSGGRPPERPRPLVARSWARMMDWGLDPDGDNVRVGVPAGEIERLRRESLLRHVINELRGVLSSVADVSQFLMVVSDADGVLLWREGAPRVQMVADRLGFVEGVTWTESVVGTNAIGTALAEESPVELFSAEHYEHTQHPWYCVAAPIHDPRNGHLLGVVDVSGPALTLHPAIGSLVQSAVRLAEGHLRLHHQSRLELLRRTTEPRLVGERGPLLVVDDDGWVAHHCGTSARERIAAPRADRAMAVPGVGLCTPERIAGGWLVRPSGHRMEITARLELGQTSTLYVCSEEAPWRTSLTPRHAQILEVLARTGASGLTAPRLSGIIFGDDEHAVTVRAEVSRLRRAVGALVTTNPYRLADGVDLTVVRP